MTSINTFVLNHYSFKPLALDERVYVQEVSHKPRGLWLSDDSDYGWKEWCDQERFHEMHLETVTPFYFTEDANILWLRTPGEIRALSTKHGSTLSNLGSIYNIDWPTIAEQYDGILITPYQWDCRMGSDTFWYYSWDVASACVWNTSILKEVSDVRTEAAR
jgi:hypothetical protein